MLVALMMVVGVVGSIAFGVMSLFGRTELEHILAFVFFACAAAGFVGRMVGEGPKPAPAPRTFHPSLGGVFSAIVGGALVSFGTVLFVATFVPALYIYLPILAIWLLTESHGETHDTPAHGHPIPAHA